MYRSAPSPNVRSLLTPGYKCGGGGGGGKHVATYKKISTCSLLLIFSVHVNSKKAAGVEPGSGPVPRFLTPDVVKMEKTIAHVHANVPRFTT